MNAPSVPDTSRCKRCGAALEDGRARDACPSCALESALDTGLDTGARSDGVLRTDAAVASAERGAGAGDDEVCTATTGQRFGDYELIEEISRGGMGVVFRARQVSLDRLVAVKMLPFGSLASREIVQRFRTEAAAAASLQHPNIVAIHEVGFHHQQHFFVMDYVAGRSLAEMVQDGPLSPKRAAKYVKTIAEAIQYAHERGILHRDLKPSNVLIDEHDQPRITDFGLAKRLQKDTELTLSGQVLGSPNYMPPEQATAHRGAVGKRSDVYSLGAILYQLLTGRAPFVASTVAETLAQVQTAEPVSPTVLNPHLPRDLKTICLKCLEKEPARRYQTAQELAEDLGRFLAGETIRARPIGPAGKALRWCRRRPVIAGLAAALVLVFLLGFGGVAWQVQRATQSRDLAQGRLYAAQMRLAHAAIQEGKTGRAKAMLQALRPALGERDFRGFDWRYLYRLCLDSPSEVFATNATGFRSIAFSPDGGLIALGTRDGFVELFDARTRQRLKSWRAHPAGIDRLAFYPRTNSWLATVSGLGCGSLKLWDISRGNLLGSVKVARAQPADFAFSPRGTYLVTQSTNIESVNIWTFDTGTPGSGPRLILKTNLDFAGPAAFSPDERTLAVCNRIKREPPWVNIVLHDLVDGTQAYLPVIHSDLIYAVAFSPDGSLLATGATDEQVVLWDVQRRTNIWTRRLECAYVASVVFGRDGRELLVGDFDQNVRSYNVSSSVQVRAWPGHSAGVNQVVTAPDGLSFVSVSDDGTARIWPLQNRSPASANRTPKPFTTIFSREDTQWTKERKLAPVIGFAVCPGQDVVALSDQFRLALYDVRAGGVLTNVDYEAFRPHGVTGFYRLAFSPDGREIAVGTAEGKVLYLDATSLHLLRGPIQVHPSHVSHIAYALNGSVLVTGGGFGAGIRLTDVATGRALEEFSGNEGNFPVQPLAVSPDGKRLATGSSEGKVLIRDIASCRLLASSPETLGLIADLKFSPDGKLLAVAQVEGPIYLWDLGGSGRWRKLAGHVGSTTVLAFSPDGRTLVTGGMDRLIRLWHPAIDQEVAILSGHTGWIWCLAFTDDGRALLSGSRDGTLRLWTALSFDEIEKHDRLGAGSPPDAPAGF